MYNVKDLVSQLTRINVTSMCVVGYKGNVKRADVGYIREALKEVVLFDH
jgi:hypothetical protein